ncbi:hypothetical protein [Corynebacterium heidelbergense]|uniref:Head-to-tail stopper n=1 Tax=Corynebacterium heidelbergense TaxID=2055947 RepID=A0A364VE51_9CORY|nr:hypothetical protein [Corynebacterium heidelbergense]RAV34920.1 hypothetical protein CWC39_00860 [Corynebacterium heidelbergense]WCZ36059.1 hypothetical protein CHEID_02465 [Corynebacterium heidelbergense]
MKYTEPVELIEPRAVDDDGLPVSGGGGRVVVNARVQPLVLDEDAGRDRSGTYTELRVFAPAGTRVVEGMMAVIRGEVFRVEEPSWDWSRFRRPVFAAHSPSVVFVVKRGEG